MGSSKGEVLDQVLPDVSGKARATIHGKVRVSVMVHVDPSGGVSEAEFDSPGPSKFFADLAMQAARKWAFTPPEVNGKSVASEYSGYGLSSLRRTPRSSRRRRLLRNLMA